MADEIESGTKLYAPAVPGSPADTYPTHLSKYGKGGLHEVDTLEERDAISMDRRYIGMLSPCAETGRTYQLLETLENAGWTDFLGETDQRATVLEGRLDGLDTTVSGIEVGDSFVLPNLTDLNNPSNPSGQINNTGATRFAEVYADSVSDDRNGRYFQTPGSSAWTKVSGDVKGRVNNLETVTDSRRQRKRRFAWLLTKWSGVTKVVGWATKDGRVDFHPGPTIKSEVMADAGIDNTPQSSRRNTLFRYRNGWVPLYMRRGGKLGFYALDDPAIAYLNSVLKLKGDITEYHVFVPIGQSNSMGLAGSLVDAINASEFGFKFEYDSTLQPLSEPVGSGMFTGRNSTGSAWTAFAKAYYDKTGCGVVIVPCAFNGTTSAQWRADSTAIMSGDTDTLFNTTVTRTNAALAALQSAGHKYKFRGFLEIQGESDRTTDPAVYKANLTNMLQGFRDAFQMDDLEMFVANISWTSTGDKAAYAAIRTAWREWILSTPLVTLACETTSIRKTAEYVNVDNTHFNGKGLNIIGQSMGLAAASTAAIQVANKT